MPSLHFTLESAKNVEEEDGISKNDLYAVITYGGQKVKSKKANDGILPIAGYHYTWNQTFALDYNSNDNDIEVNLYDADIGFDDHIGQAKFTLTKAKAQGSSHETADVVTKKHEVKGSVTAKIVLQ